MSIRGLAVLCLAPQAVLAGCLSLLDPPLDSACTKPSNQLLWPGQGRLLERVKLTNLFFDRELYDSALAQGLAVKGDLRFELRIPGPHLVEVFLAAPAGDGYSYTLEAGGRPVDTRHEAYQQAARPRPREGMRSICLLGVVSGAFTVRSDSPRYVISAIRWTPQVQFEEQLVPAWLDRARQMAADPFFENLRAGRRASLEQLYDRLALSTRPEIRREALIGQTRAAYWLAAAGHDPRDIARLDSLFRQALRLAPGDMLLRQMISSSCAERNVASARMPYSSYCGDAAPVPWSVTIPPDPPEAPEWAVTQRRLAARLEAITRWWVERRQAANGELGGGSGDDVQMLRQWGPVALGLGSQVAAEGLRRLADGLWRSGLLEGGYSARVADVAQASELSTDTLPLVAALAPEEAGVLARLRETAGCAKNWIAHQPDGNWRFRGAWFNCRQFDPEPARALDVHLNTRAMGPVLWHAYLTRDRQAIELLANWAGSWTAAMRSTAHGKPAGIFPPAVKSSSGEYLIGSDRWDKPGPGWDHLQWSGSGQEALTSLLLALHELTGEDSYLEAAGESFQALSRCEESPALCDEIRKAPRAFYEWRRRTGDPRYDGVFRYRGEPLSMEVLWGMAFDARESEKVLGHDFDMYTSEVIHTGRVYYPLPAEYEQRLFGGEAPRGDRYPTFAVTWPPSKADFARAVVAADSTSLRLRLYSFEARPAFAEVRLWRLAPGRYRWTASDTLGAHISSGDLVVTRRTQTLRVPLPPGREIDVIIR